MENKSETGNGSAENEESDSGDSLFITQKPVPHPVRSTSSPHLSHRSTPLSPRFHELGSSCESEPEDVPQKQKKRPGLPNYNFPFLKQRKPPEDRSLYIAQNRAIHYKGMAGFFKCVEEMWPSGNRRTSFESTLPTVESDNEEITPITEEEKSDEEDIKVIDKRQFVYSVKPIITKSSQPWFRSKINMSQRTQAHGATPHFGKKNTSQSASSQAQGLSNKQPQHLDSGDSDATLIDDSELFTSRSKDVNKAKKFTHIAEPSVNSTDLQPNANQGNELSASEESDNARSQSILQYNMFDIRGSSQGSGCDETGLHQSTKKKCTNKMDGDNNDNQATALSQNSLPLFDNLKTNSHKNETLMENHNNHGAEIIHDVEFDLETSPVAEPMFVSSETRKEVNGQSICGYAGQLSSSNVALNDDATVKKKKKKKRNKETADLENTENATSSLNLDSLQMLGQTDINAVEDKEASDMSARKRRKLQKKRKADPGDCIDERDVTLEKLQLNNTDTNILSALVASRGKSDHVDYSASDCIATQSDESVSVRKKKKKRSVSSATETVENANLPLPQSTQSYGAEFGISITDNEPTDIHRHKTSRKTNKNHLKAKERTEKQHDGNCDLETALPIEPASESSSKEKGVNDQCIYEDAGQPSCPNVEDLINEDATVHKKKKKKHKKKSADLDNAENGTNGVTLVPSQMPDIGQMENISAVDNVVSDTSDRKRKKLKKKRKEDPGDCNDEQDVTLKHNRQKRTDKNDSLEMVESQEKSELVNHDNRASDFIDAQSDDSVSVRKKKRKVSSAAVTVENANLPLSQSAQSHGADELGISTNDVESAKSNGLLQETDLGTKTKKKKKRRIEDDKHDNLGSNGKASDTPEMSRCNESKDCDSTEVTQPHSGDGDHVKKKKKKKKSKHEIDQPDFEMTIQQQASEVEESFILSPNASKKKKKKRYRDIDEGRAVETELEENTAKTEKIKKNRIKDVDQIISSPSHGKMSTSSGRQQTSSRAKVKKRLYNPGSENFMEEF